MQQHPHESRDGNSSLINAHVNYVDWRLSIEWACLFLYHMSHVYRRAREIKASQRIDAGKNPVQREMIRFCG